MCVEERKTKVNGQVTLKLVKKDILYLIIFIASLLGQNNTTATTLLSFIFFFLPRSHTL